MSAAVIGRSAKADRAQHVHTGTSHASKNLCLITNFYEKPQRFLAPIFSGACVQPAAGDGFLPAAICHTARERAAMAAEERRGAESQTPAPALAPSSR